MPHGHHHVNRVLRLLMSTSRCLAATPISHNCQSTCGKPCYGPHSVTSGGVPNTNNICNVLRLPNSLVSHQGGQSIWTRRTHHNTHTHTDNTRQPEPQLKSFSCSSGIPSHNSRDAIPNHNSRDAIPNHNSRNVTCLTSIPSHNSRDTF